MLSIFASPRCAFSIIFFFGLCPQFSLSSIILPVNQNRMVGRDDMDVMAKSYYLNLTSITADKANGRCETMFGGQLLTIQNQVQLDNVRVFLFTQDVQDEHFWTSGRQNGSTWFWTTSGLEMEPSQLYWHPSMSHGAAEISPNKCLTVVQDKGGFGACSSFDCSQYFRYICEVV